MNNFYTIIISFFLIFFSELGDKTQILVLSFSSNYRIKNVLMGIALGSFFSHGLAIIFGSTLASFTNQYLTYYLNLFTHISFVFLGIICFLQIKYNNKIDIKKEKKTKNKNLKNKSNIIKKISNLIVNPIVIVALNIFIGEIGDKTFLSSIGLGIKYPYNRISLIIGSIFGMLASNSIAIFFGKLLKTHFKTKTINLISSILFITIGLLGLFALFF